MQSRRESSYFQFAHSRCGGCHLVLMPSWTFLYKICAGGSLVCRRNLYHQSRQEMKSCRCRVYRNYDVIYIQITIQGSSQKWCGVHRWIDVGYAVFDIHEKMKCVVKILTFFSFFYVLARKKDVRFLLSIFYCIFATR